MISHKHKFIFIHIPKTGGTSIERALEPTISLEDPDCHAGHVEGNTLIEGKHWRTIDYQSKFPELFDSYFKFMFIRNPWDRMVSRYEWRRFLAPLKFEGERAEKISNQDFKDFLQKQGAEMFEKWCYVDLMQDSNGHQAIDFVGRFENLQNDFDKICDMIGISCCQLPLRNTTDHNHYTEYYDNETRRLVSEKFARDIDHFGYKFGD